MKNSAALVLFLLALLLPGHRAAAQQFDWGLDFGYLFANSEYDASHSFTRRSHTTHAVQITPTVGVLIPQGSNVEHRVMGGIDILKEMGDGRGLKEIIDDFLLYYDVRVALPSDASFEAAAGLLPRAFLSDDYTGIVFFDETLFFDDDVQGMLFKYSAPTVRAELALDWMGKKGDAEDPSRRERFQILTAGKWAFVPSFSLGWVGSFYHYACSPECPNVVDNHLLNPYLEWAPRFDWGAFSVNAGGILTYQCDRAADPAPRLPMGFLSRQQLSAWQLTLDNRFYWGDDLMPLYDSSYAGVPYGNSLYFADPAFHTRFDHPSWVDIVSLRYEPRIASWLHLFVSVDVLFGQSDPGAGVPAYRGWRQSAGINIDF